MPLKYKDAAKPLTSPRTPPPIEIKIDFLRSSTDGDHKHLHTGFTTLEELAAKQPIKLAKDIQGIEVVKFTK